MSQFSRSDRVAGLMRQVLSDILRKDIHDPRLELVTITGVKLSPDLRIAKIYFVTPEGAPNREAAEKAFKSASGFIKRNISHQLELRYLPELKFFYDESFDYGSHIDRLLKSIQSDNGSDHTASEK